MQKYLQTEFVCSGGEVRQHGGGVREDVSDDSDDLPATADGTVADAVGHQTPEVVDKPCKVIKKIICKMAGSFEWCFL